MRGFVTIFMSLLVLALFLGLGIWQVQRLSWKAAVLARIDARIGAAPVSIPVVPDPVGDAYLPVMARGVLGGGIRVLASTRDQGAVYRIIRAFEFGEDQRRVLVDLGMIAVDAQLPDLTGAVMVTGNLHWPDEVDAYTPAPDLAADIFYARDIKVMADVLGTEETLVVARDILPAQPGIRPHPVTSAGIPNRHLEYAVTWFLLAATWVMMTGFAVWRMKRRTA